MPWWLHEDPYSFVKVQREDEGVDIDVAYFEAMWISGLLQPLGSLQLSSIGIAFMKYLLNCLYSHCGFEMDMLAIFSHCSHHNSCNAFTNQLIKVPSSYESRILWNVCRVLLNASDLLNVFWKYGLHSEWWNVPVRITFLQRLSYPMISWFLLIVAVFQALTWLKNERRPPSSHALEMFARVGVHHGSSGEDVMNAASVGERILRHDCILQCKRCTWRWYMIKSLLATSWTTAVFSLLCYVCTCSSRQHVFSRDSYHCIMMCVLSKL